MYTRKFLILMSLALVLLVSALAWIGGQVLAKEPPGKDLKFHGKVTPAERKAAAKNFKAARQAALAAGVTLAPPTLDPGGIPHYFGPWPNWAYSPLPKGPVTSITLTSGGSGYTAPTVTIDDVYYTGTGAAATATVAGGIITGITLDSGGSGYTAPVVTIMDATGTGAAATAAVTGGLTGGIRKFVDKVPGLTPAGANLLGQYLPVAVADPSTYPGSDYYEIALVEFNEKMHSDLPPTRHRGYVQLETSVISGAHITLTNPDGSAILLPNGSQAYAVDNPHFLGPIIVSPRDVPVRIKFYNLLPKGAGGNLFVPVDTTIMGSGDGPNQIGTDANGNPVYEQYTQNRATVHLHGNNSVWISDGTPHQWITPANETTTYPEGVSVVNVPGMPDSGPRDGSMTFYYTNAQSARLMFYHDHAYGITRLNVYIGEAAGYLVTDQVEQDLINGTNNSGVNPGLAKVLPDIGIPLVIQDRTFVDATTIAAQDPTWNRGTTPPVPNTGDLWYPHVYMPAQNPYDPSGGNTFGRWHYAAWFWPPATNLAHPPVPNEYYDPVNAPWEPPMRPDFPNPSNPGEAFMDTPIVNGTVYPYLEVEPKAYRFRILNAADDRFFNLQFYVADPAVITADGRSNTEVKMVPAPDGREGGVPDLTTAGPNWIQIGTEGGFLPAPVLVPNQYVTWNGDPTTFNFGNVDKHSLLVGTAERADVIVDFSAFAGKTLILYNDAPAAFPAPDSRYDYYTGDPDQTDTGGAPSTQPGYGPNTRTIMQIRVAASAPAPVYDLTTLGAVFAKTATKRGVFEKSQDPIIIPSAAYNSAYNQSFPADTLIRQHDYYANFFNGPLTGLTLRNGGSGYTSAPTVTITGGGGSGATATATLGPRSVASVTVDNGGSSYTSAPAVSFSGGGGSGAVATALLSPTAVASVTVTNGGRGYASAPTVTISPPTTPGGVQATATATVQGNQVRSITVTNGGSGYTSAPTVTITGGGGTGATATAALAPTTVASVTVTNGGSGYTSPPAVSFTGGGGLGAAATATLGPGAVGSLTLTNGGTGYISAPTVSFTGGGGSGATAVAVGLSIYLQPKALQDEMGEVFDDYGRMMVMLGLELPFTAAGVQNFVMYGYASPPVELLKGEVYGTPLGSMNDGTQIWKITHNGVDSHTIHVHLFNAQLINRVAWDGAVSPPDLSELGWKETFRVNPLEHTIIAFKPIIPNVPFLNQIPNSIRPIDPTKPLHAMLMGGPGGFFDPSGNPVTVMNHLVNFGWEYVYHCHILAHEEMDMMHATVLAIAPQAPSNLVATLVGSGNNQRAVLSWTDNSMNETSFTVQRSTDAATWTTIATLPSTTGPGTGATVTYTNTGLARRVTYYYRVVASNVVGDTMNAGFPTMTVDSPPTASASVTTN